MGLIKSITPEMQPSTQKAGTSQPVSGVLFREILLKHQIHAETYNLQNNKNKTDETQCTIILYFHRWVRLKKEEPKTSVIPLNFSDRLSLFGYPSLILS